MVTPAQIRAARGLLGWKQSDLAREAKVSLTTVRMIEQGKTRPLAETLGAIERALFAGGVICFEIPGEERRGRGVRFR
jgi:transcriptional regulator with XRE-family HTH domain